jgi:hypothetical protein
MRLYWLKDEAGEKQVEAGAAAVSGANAPGRRFTQDQKANPILHEETFKCSQNEIFFAPPP